MYYSSPTSTITPALVPVAMSRSDSRDSTTSSSSSRFVSAPMTVSYSSSPSSYLARTSSNTSTSSTSSRPIHTTRRDSSSTWIPSPYRSCHHQPEEVSSYLSDDDLLYIAPSATREMPVTSIPSTLRKKELTTEEQIALLRDQQEKQQERDLIALQQQRRQAAAMAQKAVRFAPEQSKGRRPSNLKRKTATTATRKASN